MTGITAYIDNLDALDPSNLKESFAVSQKKTYTSCVKW